MITLSSVNEKAILEPLVNNYGDSGLYEIIFSSGVKNESEARSLAKFYWLLVDRAEGENMEYWLEKIYTSFSIHVGNVGFESVWEDEMP